MKIKGRGHGRGQKSQNRFQDLKLSKSIEQGPLNILKFSKIFFFIRNTLVLNIDGRQNENFSSKNTKKFPKRWKMFSTGFFFIIRNGHIFSVLTDVKMRNN